MLLLQKYIMRMNTLEAILSPLGSTQRWRDITQRFCLLALNLLFNIFFSNRYKCKEKQNV